MDDDGERWVTETLRVKLLLRLENLCVRAKVEETIPVYSWQSIRKGILKLVLKVHNQHFFSLVGGGRRRITLAKVNRDSSVSFSLKLQKKRSKSSNVPLKCQTSTLIILASWKQFCIQKEVRELPVRFTSVWLNERAQGQAKLLCWEWRMEFKISSLI